MTCDRCEGCPLEGVAIPAPIPKQTMSRFVVVTDAPSPHNLSEGRLMNRQASSLFGKYMTAAGFSRDDFVFFPQVRCPHDVDQLTTKEVKAIRDHCRGYMLDYLSEVQPEAVLPLGNNAARQVMGRAVKITGVRGIAERSSELGTVVFPLLSPGMVLMYPQHLPTFETDCKTLRDLSDVSYNLRVRSKSQLGRYEIIDDLQFLIDMEPRVLFFDTENTGLSHFQAGPDDVRTYDPDIHDRKFSPSAAVLTMQFCVAPGEAYMLVWDHPEKPATARAKRRLREQLRTLLNNPRTIVVGQNAKYDRVYVEAVVGVGYPIGGDTLMLACLIDENSIAKGQDMLVRQYVPEMAGYADHFNATTDKSRMWEVPLNRLIDYGCGDVDSGLRLYRALRKIVYSDSRLKAHYRRVSIPGLNAFSLIEQRGMLVDEEALDEFEEVMDEEVTKQYDSLIDQVPRSIKRKHLDLVTEKKGKISSALKFSRPDFTRDILFYHKDGFRLKPKVFTPKTAKLPPDKRIASVSSKDHLPYFYDECPFTYELSEYVKNERLLNTNIRGFKKKYIVDGLVRPTYSLAKTVTGRTSSEEPNGQNIPKRGKMAKAYRRSFVAPEGYFVLEADLSQAELRISACMANEPTMLRIYREGGDIHKETALIVLGISKARFAELPKDEQKSARQKAKAVNFGFCIAEGQRVLTHVGLVPIEDIQDWHRVWDGVEWVTHQGLVCRGEQEVITYDGLTATPDHEVFTEGHSDPVRLGDCASSLEKRRIVVSGDASHPVRVIIPDRSVREARAQPTLLRSGVLRVRRVTLDIGGQYLVRQDYELQMSDEEVPSRCASRDSWAEIRCYGATVREVDTQEFEKLQRTRYSRVVSDETEFHRVGINEVAFGDLQGQGLRPDQQRRRLLSREFTAGLAFGESKEPAEKETGAPRKVRVYDLIDAGPRRRFTVEGRLVSNCYGMGWRKFIGYAKTQYGVEFTDEEAQRVRSAFFNKYSRLPAWHERQRAEAMRTKEVRSYSGRIRHLPMIDSDDEMIQQEAGRQSINSPVQEFASSLGVMAIGRLSAEIDPEYLAPIAFVHDAIFCYVKAEYLEWGAKTLKWYMETNPIEEWFGVKLACPIVADVSFGLNFGDTYELEGLTLDDPYDFTSVVTNDDGEVEVYVPEQREPHNYGLVE